VLDQQAEQAKILLIITYQFACQIMRLVCNVRRRVNHLRLIAPQWTCLKRWFAAVRKIG
jgi:hypothetical protein